MNRTNSPNDRRYAPIEPITRKTAEQALRINDPEELGRIVIAVGLHEDDFQWAQSFCLLLTQHEHYNVRANAILSLGHLARRFGTLDRKHVQPIIEAGFVDVHEIVRMQAHAAASDVEHFLRWKLRKPKTADEN